MRILVVQSAYLVALSSMRQVVSQEEANTNLTPSAASYPSTEPPSTTGRLLSTSASESQNPSTNVNNSGITVTLSKSFDSSVSIASNELSITAQPSSTDVISSMVTFSPMVPTPSGSNITSSDESSDIQSYGLTEGPESTDPVPPDVTTPEEHLEEQANNKLETAISVEEAEKIAIMETVMFDHFVNTAPAPADVGKLIVPANVSSCAIALQKRGLIGSSTGTERRSLRGWESCTYVGSIEIPVYFHYILTWYNAARPTNLTQRINDNVSLFSTPYL
jgi:hypothetical protein